MTHRVALALCPAVLATTLVATDGELRASRQAPSNQAQAISRSPSKMAAQEEELLKAAIRGELNVVQALLAAGVSPNFKEPNGQTALIYAAFGGQLKLVEILLAAGAEVNTASANGNTALILAANKGHLETVRLLLAKGANAEAARADGGTPLTEAVQSKGNAGIVSLLLDSGSRVDHAKKNGLTALNMAVTVGDLAVMKLLLDRGADPNLRSLDVPPLFFAVRVNNVEAAQLLIARGADINATMRDGRSPRAAARESKNAALMSLFQGNPTRPDVDSQAGTLSGRASAVAVADSLTGPTPSSQGVASTQAAPVATITVMKMDNPASVVAGTAEFALGGFGLDEQRKTVSPKPGYVLLRLRLLLDFPAPGIRLTMNSFELRPVSPAPIKPIDFFHNFTDDFDGGRASFVGSTVGPVTRADFAVVFVVPKVNSDSLELFVDGVSGGKIGEIRKALTNSAK